MKTPRYITGVVWSVVNACASVLLPFAVFVIFAHIIAPVLIGVVAMAVACTEVVKTLGLQGLYEALLHEREDRRESQEAALFVLLGAGVVTAGLYLIVLLALAHLTSDIGANFAVLGWLGLRILFDLAAVQPQVELAHRLAFRTLALRAVVGNAIAGAIGIGLVPLAGGIAGLVVYQICQSAISFLVSVAGSGALVRPRFRRACFQRMLPEASLSTGVRFIAATVNNLDQILVAAMVGSLLLAFFSLGKRIENTFITVVTSFASILFQPLFAQTDPGARHDALARALAVVTIACGFPAAVFVCNAEPLVRMVFGPQWIPAANVAAALAISGFVRASGFVPGALMSVSRRNRQLLLTSLTTAAAGAIVVVATVRLGLLWCAVALIVKNALVVGWMAIWLRMKGGEPILPYITNLAVPFALILGAVEMGHWLGGGIPPGLTIPAQLARVALSAVPGALVGGGYFALLFEGHLAERAFLRGGNARRAIAVRDR